MSTRFTYRFPGGLVVTSLDLDDLATQDVHLRCLAAPLGQVRDHLQEGLSAHVDTYVEQQAANLQALRDSLNALGVLCELVLHEEAVEDSTVDNLERKVLSLGSGPPLGRLHFDQEVTREQRLRAVLAHGALRLAESLDAAPRAQDLCVHALTHEHFLHPPADPGTEALRNPARLALLDAFMTDLLADLRLGMLQRMEEDPELVETLIQQHVLPRLEAGGSA